MAPITDLSWRLLNTKLKQRLGVNQDLIEIDAYGRPTTIDIGAILQDPPMSEDGSTALGVVKCLAILLDSCRDGQVEVNTGQPAGERLDAFPAPTSAAPVGTLVPVTRTMVARADLSSVTKVIGRVA